MKIWIFIIVLLLIPAFAAAQVPKNCYQNFTAVRCGEQTEFNSEEYCKTIKLVINECYSEGSRLKINFSGIEYFDASETFTKIRFEFRSRTWTWVSNENTLPQNSTIMQDGKDFIATVPIGNKDVTSVQITIPYCYEQLDKDLKKVYPRTQSGSKCIPEGNATEIIMFDEVPAEIKEETQLVNQTVQIDDNDDGMYGVYLLAGLAFFILVLGIIVLRPRKK